MSARLAYLASDRPDVAFACTQCRRAVGKATRADLTRLKRTERFSTPRATCRVEVPAADCLATWSSTQKVVSLSSAELEYYSMVRCASEAVGLANTGREAHVRICTGSVAARGLTLRSGSRAIKHKETKCVWLQKSQVLNIERIRGTINPADLMTKHLDGKRLVMLCMFLNIKHIGSRPFSSQADDGH